MSHPLHNLNDRYFARFVPNLGFYDSVTKTFHATHHGVTKYSEGIAFNLDPLFPNERMTEVPQFDTK